MRARNLIQRIRSFHWLGFVPPAMFLLGLAVACFIGGSFVAEFDFAWYRASLKPSFQGLRALREKRHSDWTVYGWFPVAEKPGTSIYHPELAYEGLTLYTSLGDSPSASLISMTGEEVHRWQLPFREAWPESRPVSAPVPENRIHWRCVRLFPNGDLLANYGGIADTPHGYGLVKINRNSRIIWRYSQCAHHDFDLDDAGKIYILTHSIRHNSVVRAPHLRTPLLEDFVAVLSPEGRELQRVPIYNAFAKSRFRDYLQSIRSNEQGDHTHANKVAVISAAFAKKHKYCSIGDVLISLRNTGVLAILNLKQQKIVWASRGIWVRQHDSDPLENGNILIFDNRGNFSHGGTSRILEWNPSKGNIVWSFSGTTAKPFQSTTRGSQQLLPNGNVLITESDRGRILEVTRNHEIAWEFYNPKRSGEKVERVAVVCGAERYEAEKLDFLQPLNVARSTANRSDNESKEKPQTVR